MVAVAGLTLDSGLLITRSANVKSAADAAAYAASDRLFRRWFFDNGADPTGQARLAALRVAAANGYHYDTNATVIIRISPDNYSGGAEAGQPVPPGTVEVVVRYAQPTTFSGLLRGGSNLVTARTVSSTQWEPGTNGLAILDPSSDRSLTVRAGTNIRCPGGVVTVNSASPSAMRVGSGANISALEFDLTATSSWFGSGKLTGTTNIGTPPIADPLAFLPEPSVPAADRGAVNAAGAATMTLLPGHYSSISVADAAAVTLNPGTYYVDNGLACANSGSIQGTGVLIYNAGSNVVLNTTGSVNLTPPSTGLYRGITIWQGRSSGGNVAITGGAYVDLVGTIYVPNSTVWIKAAGSVGGSVASQVIANKLHASGAGTLNLTPTGTKAPQFRRFQFIQ